MIENIYIEPSQDLFARLSKRPVKNQKDMSDIIEEIFDNVSKVGDQALINYNAKFDGYSESLLKVTENEIVESESLISEELKNAIQVAKSNIEKFHSAQISKTLNVEIIEGVVCKQKSIGIEKVGLYIPGGTAPLFSTVLMLAVPAVLAGCKEIIICSPPNQNGKINPAILWAASICGVSKIYKVGGAQAIAAMTMGTETIAKVAKIFGPGNQYVTAAKLNAQSYGVAIDMPAGPSELLVYAANDAIPSFVASDLLSQAEHGVDSQVILVAQSSNMVDLVNEKINEQVEELPRKEIIQAALQNSKAIVIEDVNDAWSYVNEYAPEHLIVASELPEKYTGYIVNAGSVFLGNYCPESAGDYASGTNHTLPTDGWAKSFNGVNVDSFSRKITFQNISKSGLNRLGDTIITMAQNELLDAHANAVKIRLDKLKSEGNG